MPANTEPLHEANDREHYFYRRRLTPAELLPAVAVGVGAGLIAFYVARLLMQRTPLLDPGTAMTSPRSRRRAPGVGG